MRVWSNREPGLQSSQGSVGRGSLSKLPPVSVGRPQVLAGRCLEISVLLPLGPLYKAVHNMQLASFQSNKQERVPKTEETLL